MTQHNTIANDEEMFQQFKIDLALLTKQYQKEGFNHSINGLQSIIDRINDMQADHIDEIHNNDLFDDGIKIDSEMNKIINAYFQSYSDDNILCKETTLSLNNFFPNKKLHQLAHSNGIFKKQIEKSNIIDPEIKNIILIHLFLDYYESFPMYLRPFISRLWRMQHNEKPKINGTYQVYRRLDDLLSSNSYINNTVLNYYKPIRNRIAHSNSIVLQDRLEYIENHKIDFDDIDKIKQHLKLFHRIVITFATEFDINFLSIGLRCGNNSLFNKWFPYLKIYNESWQRIGN